MKKMKAMKNKMKFRYLVLVFAMVFVGVCSYLGYSSDAAEDLYLSCDGAQLDSATAYQMKNKQITLILGSQEDPIYADKDKYEVRWSIETGKDIAEITEGSEQIYGIVSAKSPGEVTVLATVYNKVGDQIGTTVGSVTCKIQVVFAIDTSTDDNVFKYPYSDSEDKAIFLRTGDAAVPLSLNYGESSDAQWTIANTEVAEISEEGVVTAKGAGSTKITSTYTPPDSPDTTYTTTIDVYVYPNVSDVDSDYKKNTAFGLDSGSVIYTDTNFENSFESIQRKMAWVIKKDDGNGGEYVVADSLGTTSELIDISAVSSRSNQLKVDAKAGKYYVYFYPKNAYESEAKHISEEVFAPTVLTLSVYANFDDYQETIPIGSTYDIAEAFNLTVDEFMQYFDVTLTSNAGAAGNYATLSNSVVTAIGKNEGKTTVVDAAVTVKDAYKHIIAELLNPNKVDLSSRTKFDVELTIADVFSLDQTYTTMYAGATVNLNAYFNSQNIAATNIKWSSSNEDYAKVSATGAVEAIKVTTEDVVITATYNNADGAEFVATCQIKIIQTADNLEISQKEAEMNVGDSIVLNVTANPEVAYPPYQWYISDEDCLSLTLTADNKTATITAKKVPANGKTVTVTVTNPLNKKSQVCNVTINAPYEELKLTEDSVTMKAGASHQLRYDYKPSNVTQTELEWKSLDTSIVTVDEYGTLSAKAPGMTYIMVSPVYNPNGVYAQCAVTVLSGCESMELSEKEVTLNTEEERIIKVTLNPKGCSTTLEWSVTDDSVASVTYDEETNQATIKGKKAGKVIVFVKSEDGPSGQIDVTVLQPCLELSFSPQEYEMKAGETYTPGLVKTPEDTTDEITWSTYDSAVATVDANGLITAVKTGSTFIQATSASGRVAVVKINVKEGITSVSLKPEETEIEVGQTITLAPEFTPAVAYDKSMTWTVADSNVVKIEPEGSSNVKVTGLVGGVTLVKGVAKDGGHVVSCLIKVKEKSTAVTLKPTSKYLQKGKSFTIKATVTSETATDKSVTWSTSKKKVATVSSSGVVKGKKIGTAYITATANDGSGASARCKVMVVRKVTSIKLNKYKAKVLVGDTCKLKATIKPKKATVKGIEWSSSDNTIATVDSSGRIHGIAAGLVKIRAKAKDGSGKSAVCLVTVMDPVPATGVDVTNNDIIVAKGRQIQSGIRIAPANSTDKIKYFSDNKKVAKINKRGKIYAKKVGQATVYGETSNGQMGYADVLVVAMNRKRLTLRTYDTETLRVDEISQGVTWYSKNPLIASVDQSGKVMGRRRGTTRIYAKVRGLRLSCKVTVTGLN
nr:Ig-like domain-containing protein [Eubacterium sp.]